ncbi:hypothetical protein PA57_00483 [Pseudomonas aeruginosa]|nr:hypothetical protein PA57_00483 [Pseudomonas aeruginosa]
MSRSLLALLLALVWLPAGCARGGNGLPYDAWRLGFLVPN